MRKIRWMAWVLVALVLVTACGCARMIRDRNEEKNDTVTCPSCQKICDEENKFCPSCGSSLEDDRKEKEQAQTQTESDTGETETREDACGKCGGKGKTTCIGCKGSGHLLGSLPCMICEGEGKTPCTACDGTGVDPDKQTHTEMGDAEGERA